MSENSNHHCIIVGIAGASASGKSLIASTIYNELRAKVGDHQIGVITEDSYYKDQSHLTMEERVKTNYDHPNALDHRLLSEHLEQLMRGEAVNIPTYSYTEHTRTSDVEVVVQWNRYLNNTRRLSAQCSCNLLIHQSNMPILLSLVAVKTVSLLMY